MPSIEGITQAFGYIAAYAGEKKKDDRLEQVIVWSVIRFDGDAEPDEVVGQIFDGTCITEATAVDDEEGYGEFVGYFRENEDGRTEAKRMCEEFRKRKSAIEEQEDEEPKNKRKNKKKEPEDEGEDEGEDEDNEGDEDDDGEDDEDEDDFSSWDDDE
jgi:hypothetical protein